LREQVITPRAAPQLKGRNGATGTRTQSLKRPAAKKTSGGGAAAKKSGTRRSDWATVVRYAPLAAKSLLAVVAGLLVFAGYRAAASAPFFELKSVEVIGVSRASRDDVKETVERAVARVGVWKADLDALSGELRELPWVRGAYVQRVLPSGLRVRVFEREPRLVALTQAGRLYWVDDEGVALGPASATESEFIVRGLEEERNAQARARNRERIRVALEMKGEWGRDRVAERVSEVNLGDLRDVRVQLAGDDSRIDVRLGREDYVARLREALEELDARRETFSAPVTYIDLTTGRNAIFGFPQDVRAAALQRGPQQQAAPDAPGNNAPAARGEGGTAARPAARPEEKPRDARRDERKRGEKKKEAATDAKPAAATRERRVG
jgi:cell division septal protein FtsQ